MLVIHAARITVFFCVYYFFSTQLPRLKTSSGPLRERTSSGDACVRQEEVSAFGPTAGYVLVYVPSRFESQRLLVPLEPGRPDKPSRNVHGTAHGIKVESANRRNAFSFFNPILYCFFQTYLALRKVKDVL